MPKAPRLTASEAESLLLHAGFAWIRTKGSHRIYQFGARRVVVPFHSGITLHPKTVTEVMAAIHEIERASSDDETLR